MFGAYCFGCPYEFMCDGSYCPYLEEDDLDYW